MDTVSKHTYTCTHMHAHAHSTLWFDGCLLLCTDVVREQAEVAVGRDEGEDALGLPALEADAGVEADIIQQPGVLSDRQGKATSRN